jgi:squalene synthase HpnC
LKPLLDATPHYENFPVGSWLVPQNLRPAYASIYRFARYADDIADEGDLSDSERLDELQRLANTLQGEDQHPIASQVMPFIAAHQLNSACFSRLLKAFSQDVVKKRYTNVEELLAYCQGSANPVGELVLGLFTSSSGKNLTSAIHLEKSDQICSALQLINFLQDMSIDWQKNRVYMPLDLAMKCGLDGEMLEAQIRKSSLANAISPDAEGKALKQAIELLHVHTQALLNAGRPLITMVPTRLSLELRAICAGGQRILDLLAEGQFDPFSKRPKLGLKDLPSLFQLFFSASSALEQKQFPQ